MSLYGTVGYTGSFDNLIVTVNWGDGSSRDEGRARPQSCNIRTRPDPRADERRLGRSPRQRAPRWSAQGRRPEEAESRAGLKQDGRHTRSQDMLVNGDHFVVAGIDRSFWSSVPCEWSNLRMKGSKSIGF